MGAISRFKGERPVRVRVQLDFMFICLVPDEGWGGEGEGVVLLIERLNDLKRRKKKKREIKRVEIKLLARVFLSLMLLYLRSWSLFF